MTDWLDELREEKQRAMALAQAGASQRASAENQLRGAQEQLVATINRVEVERLLAEFTREILRDHPLFPNSFVSRTVISRGSDSSQAAKESPPWSGRFENNFLPQHLELANGRYVVRVDWRLHLNSQRLNGETPKSRDIHISISAQGVQVDGQFLPAPTADHLKSALVDAFRHTLPGGTLQPERVRTYRQRKPRRRGHRRGWRALLVSGRPMRRTVIAVALIIIVLSALLGVMVKEIVGNRSNDSGLWQHAPASHQLAYL